jgi:exodeoxyribonuclease-3
MQEEIDGMDGYTSNGLIDTFRLKNDHTVKYSWWSYRAGARDRNIGWRIDYALVSDRLEEKVKDAYILNEIKGSDHCPVGVIVK